MAPLDSPLRRVIEAVNRVLLGKDRQVRLALSCLLAGGHLLIEDIPGVGKTTLAQVLARTLGLEYRRIQFTSDLLPADVVGISVFDREAATFRFHPGPVFSQVLLADEINRGTPRTQGALLEAMEEGQVTVDGHSHPLPDPFLVIATQNPIHQIGTFPLPESQLDRFLIRLTLGYPDAAAERALLAGEDRRHLVAAIEPIASGKHLMGWRKAVRMVHAAPALIDYVQALAEESRRCGVFEAGLSPRGTLALLNAARSWAFLHGSHKVTPEHVQAVFAGVAGHRLRPRNTLADDPALLLARLVASVPLL